MKTRGLAGPSSGVRPWGEVLLGVTPLFLLGLATVLRTYLPSELWAAPWAPVVFLGGAYCCVAVALVIGWVRGFPRWFYLYPGLVVIAAVFGVWAAAFKWGYLPGALLSVGLGVVLIAVLVVLVRSRSLRRPLIDMRRDWTLLSCLVYGLTPLVQSLVFDDASANNETPFLILSSMALPTGALLCLRGDKAWQRLAPLLGGMTAVLVAGALDKAHFAGGLGPWLGQPGTWRGDLPWFANLWVLLAGAMLAPGLLSLIPRSTQRGKTEVSETPV